jgi:hypothetical protein
MRMSVDVNGTPSLVCSPSSEDELTKFLTLAFASVTPTPTLRVRPSNRKEEDVFVAALTEHLHAGGVYDAFFAAPL